MTALARLSFWVPPERVADFGAAYEKWVAPALAQHGLVISTERGRATVDSVFSRLFTVETLGTLFAQRRDLFADPAWTDLRERLGSDFVADGPDSLIRCQLVPYQCPAIPDRTVPAGGGTRRGVWRTLGVQDGLPSPMVNNILPLPGGPLWFTGRADLTCYDGETFATYTTSEWRVADNYVPLLQTRDGSLWFNGLGGLTRYDGETFSIYTAADGLAGDDPRCLLEDREGHLWIGDEAGVTRHDGETFQPFTTRDGLASVQVSSILEDRDGILWFGGGAVWRGPRKAPKGLEQGATRYDGKTFRALTGSDSMVDHAVYSIMQDRHGRLWFGGDNQVTRFDGERSSTLDARDGLAGGRIVTMLEDRDGDLWFGSNVKGIGRFDGRAFTTCTADDGLADNQLASIVEDEEGYVWVSTPAGLSRYEGAHWTTFTARDGLPSPFVFSTLQDRTGTMWFGTAGGLVRYDGQELETFTTEHGMALDRADYVVEDLDGNLWTKGLWESRGTRYDGETFTPFTLGEDLDVAHSGKPAVDAKGHVWFPTGHRGVVRYDGHDFSRFTRDDGLPSDQVSSVSVDRSGGVLLTTPEGISRYDGETITPVTLFSGWGFRGIVVAEDRQGSLWIGSADGGVARFDGNGLEVFTHEDGLKPGMMRSILEDTRGHLWFGIHGAGIVRYDGLVFQDLHHRDGLVADTVQDILQDRDGDFWVATDGGVTRYRSSAVPPAIRIKEVVADRSYGTPQEVALPSSQPLVQFAFQGRSLTTPPDRMVYVCRLEGYEEEWQTTRRTEVRYPDLPIGEYVFQVKAVDRDLNYSEPATIHLTIEPDPYRQALSQALSGSSAAGEFIGSSAALRRVQEELGQVAATDVTVLILGETGTGKGLAARTVHQCSPRKDGPFVQVNCGALPDSLVESELFGHEKGAFTGAHARKLGKVELAREGTLMLDEIGDLPLDAQVKLLRLLEEGTFERVGGERTLSAEVRVVAATNRDLQQMVQDGEFREDLYFRLAVFPVRLPPLRERKEDIPLLAFYFMERMAAHVGKEVRRLDDGAVSALQRYPWPGNVRELEHALQRAVIVCRGSTIGAGEIALEFGAGQQVDEIVPLEEYERRYIRKVLERVDWVVSGSEGAAALLGINASTLRGRMRKLGIQRE